MINFRYHVVSLVAVFLALAVGIVMGSTVIKQTLIDQLTTDAHNFAKKNQEYRGQIDQLDSRVAFLNQFGKLIVPAAMKGKLAGRTVTLLTEDATPDSAVNSILDALRTAGAATPSRLRLTAAWALNDQADQERLSSVTEVGAGDAKTLVARVAAKIGARLASPADATADTDLLRRLSDAGFLRLDDVKPGPYPPAGAAIIVVPAGVKDAQPAQDTFFVSLLRAIGSKRPVAVAEPYRSVDSLCTRVRANGELSAADATIDHVDTPPGQMSLVWALRGLADGKPPLHYGVLRSADAVAPELEP